MIGMNMRIDDELQLEVALVQQGLVRLDLDRRVDNRRLMGAARSDEVGSTSTALIQELFEIHDDDPGSLKRFACAAPCSENSEPECATLSAGYPIASAVSVKPAFQSRR